MKNKAKWTFSKRMVAIMLTISIIDVQLSYILALLGHEVNESLSTVIVTEIIAVSLGYFLKSFFETREEENVRLRERELDFIEEEKEE